MSTGTYAPPPCTTSELRSYLQLYNPTYDPTTSTAPDTIANHFMYLQSPSRRRRLTTKQSPTAWTPLADILRTDKPLQPQHPSGERLTHLGLQQPTYNPSMLTPLPSVSCSNDLQSLQTYAPTPRPTHDPTTPRSYFCHPPTPQLYSKAIQQTHSLGPAAPRRTPPLADLFYPYLPVPSDRREQWDRSPDRREGGAGRSGRRPLGMLTVGRHSEADFYPGGLPLRGRGIVSCRP